MRLYTALFLVFSLYAQANETNNQALTRAHTQTSAALDACSALGDAFWQRTSDIRFDLTFGGRRYQALLDQFAKQRAALEAHIKQHHEEIQQALIPLYQKHADAMRDCTRQLEETHETLNRVKSLKDLTPLPSEPFDAETEEAQEEGHTIYGHYLRIKEALVNAAHWLTQQTQPKAAKEEPTLPEIDLADSETTL
jgi:hypothetical protein